MSVRSVIKEAVRRGLPHRVRPHKIRGGLLRGYWIVTSWHDYPAAITGRTERSLVRWFTENVRPGETWLDVGAHYGYTAIALAKCVEPSGRVFAFEPSLETAGHLAQTGNLNGLSQLEVFPFGLCACETIEARRLPLTRGMLDSTIMNQDAGAPALFTRFDWFAARVESMSGPVHGLKIDVQGMELEVLDGMVETLSEWKPKLIVELHRGVSRDGLTSRLDSIGYGSEGVSLEDDDVGGGRSLRDNHSYLFRPNEGVR